MRPTKEEVMAFLKPEPVTEEELTGLEKLQPGDYEIYSERLNMILAECKEVFIRVGISHFLHSGDLIVGLHTAQGDLISACLGTFIHSVTAQNPIKYIMRNFKDNPRVGVNEGDIFYASESTYGGIHGADQLALMPIFHEGRHIAWASAGTHIHELGGTEPGGLLAGAKSRYDEGMNLTPIKIARNYQLCDDIVEMTVNFISRAPRQQSLDLRGRISAADRLRIRVQELAEQKGSNFIQGLLRKVLMVTEEGARYRISRWNDGIYRTVLFGGAVGRQASLWRICCTAHKEGDHILLDYTGTSPENDSSWNSMPWVIVCYAALYVYSHGFHDLPVCNGALAPIDFRIPDGSLISANWDAAISFAPPLCENNHLILTQIFARMMFNSPDRHLIAAHTAGVAGASGGMWTGVNQFGVPYVGESTWSMNTSGQGARVDMDGMDSALFASAVHSIGSDAEEVEVDHPVIHTWQKHEKDSPGHGKYRGGASGYTGTAIYGVPYLKQGSMGHKGRMPVGQGIFGGYPSFGIPDITVNKTNFLELMAKGEKNLPTSPNELIREKVIDGEYEVHMKEHDPELVYEGALRAGGGRSGGHGYGDVLERDPQAVVDDVRHEIISDWAATNIYHVAYDVETWTADEEKTIELRRKEREDRLRRAKSYDEFENEWLQKKPPEDILTYYGSWPDAKIVNPIIRI